ncbi:hypothetical protein [Flavobacterium sp.]|uniref:hypothetical protein n=1 Tax=Flavobacterium sp. TaxID=239 RepID=UPI002B4B0278|nr:hypothetical protein [Flavobacterium sp.]HLP65501.1 hypothetical protein [Flavobacterium sp.]
MTKTSNDYCITLKQKYELEKSRKYSGFLFDPTPGLLKELCLIFFDSGLKKKDMEVFESFFTPRPESGLRKAIERFDGEKLRPVCNFLKGTSKKTNSNILNLIAVLIDFEDRPFAHFVNSNRQIDNQDNVQEEEVTHDEINTESKTSDKKEKERPTPIVFVVDDSHAAETKSFVGKSFKNTPKKSMKIVGIGLGSIAVLSFGYTAKNMIFPNKECMKWVQDHYEMVDCLSEAQGVGSYGAIVPYNEVEFNRIELKVCDTTQFFIDGNTEKPKVWYDKEKDELRCFNMDGINPETGDHLRPITTYMISKYVESCK